MSDRAEPIEEDDGAEPIEDNCAAGTEPIEDGEIIYRRIPTTQGWFDPQTDPRPSPEAFKPTKLDTTGISFSRRKYKTVEEAARGCGKEYFVAELRAGDLSANSLHLVPRPTDEDPSHCELLQINLEDKDTNSVKESKLQLSELTRRVLGPFPGKSAES